MRRARMNGFDELHDWNASAFGKSKYMHVWMRFESYDLEEDYQWITS